MTSRAKDETPAVTFRDELPVPSANVAIYEQIYVLEQWLRRLAYAGLMARFGGEWRGALPAELLARLNQRLRQLRGRVHLDVENSNNAIWLLTLEELRQVLLADSTWPVVNDLIGLPQRVLEAKLAELREVRNVVGHNRAVSPNTAVIATAISLSMQPGIDSFKGQLLYEAPRVIHPDVGSDPATDSVPSRFADLISATDSSSFQPMLTESQYFFSLTRLPVHPFDTFLALKQFLGELSSIEDSVLAVLVNRSGAEFTLVWPKRSSPEIHESVMQFFLYSHDLAWTRTPYELQSVSAVCDPWIWFYENEPPDIE